MSLTTQQLEQRLNYVTGSDAAIICGVSPWGNVVDLWKYKMRLACPPDISNKSYIKAGNYLEDAVARWFCDETQKEAIVDDEFKVHKLYKFMGGNIDRKIVGENAILECKTTANPKGWGEQGESIIPPYYLCQVAHYAMVCDVDRVYIAVLIRGNELRYYTYERNENLEEVILEKEEEFWYSIEEQIQPEPSNSAEIIAKYANNTVKEAVIADNDIYNEYERLLELKNSLSELEKQKQEAEEKLKLALKNKETLLAPTGEVIATWKPTKPVKRFDANALKKEHEDIYSKYVKECDGYRRFLIK